MYVLLLPNFPYSVQTESKGIMVYVTTKLFSCIYGANVQPEILFGLDLDSQRRVLENQEQGAEK
jgi:hypothetical protein